MECMATGTVSVGAGGGGMDNGSGAVGARGGGMDDRSGLCCGCTAFFTHLLTSTYQHPYHSGTRAHLHSLTLPQPDPNHTAASLLRRPPPAFSSTFCCSMVCIRQRTAPPCICTVRSAPAPLPLFPPPMQMKICCLWVCFWCVVSCALCAVYATYLLPYILKL
jgi:hypothetical protein